MQDKIKEEGVSRPGFSTVPYDFSANHMSYVGEVLNSERNFK